MGYKSDIEIAQETTMAPITEIAAKAGIDEKYLEPVSYTHLHRSQIRSWLKMVNRSMHGRKKV